MGRPWSFGGAHHEDRSICVNGISAPRLATSVAAVMLMAACGAPATTTPRRSPRTGSRAAARSGTPPLAYSDALTSYVMRWAAAARRHKRVMERVFTTAPPPEKAARAEISRLVVLHRDLGREFAGLARPTDATAREAARLFDRFQRLSSQLLRDWPVLLDYAYGKRPAQQAPIRALLMAMDRRMKVQKRTVIALFAALCRYVRSHGVVAGQPRHVVCDASGRP